MHKRSLPFRPSLSLSLAALATLAACDLHRPPLPAELRVQCPGADCPEPQAEQPGVVALQVSGRPMLGQRVRLQIGGARTDWDPSSGIQLSFHDPNIRVESLQVINPTLLEAEVQIGPTDPRQPGSYARLGPHKVTLDVGGRTLLVHQAFPIEAPLLALPSDGAGKPSGFPLQQGAVGTFVVERADDPQAHFPVDAQVRMLGEELQVLSQKVDRHRIIVQVAVNVLSRPLQGLYVEAAGQPALVLPPDQELVSLRVQSRRATPLPLGQRVAGALEWPNQTPLYELQVPEQAQLLSVDLSTGPKGPLLSVLGSQGRFQWPIALRRAASGPGYFMTTDAMRVFFLLYDPAGQGGADQEYKLLVRSQPVTTLLEPVLATDPAEPNRQLQLKRGPVLVPLAPLPAHQQGHHYSLTPDVSGPVTVMTQVNPDAMGHPVLELREGDCFSDALLFAAGDDGRPVNQRFEARAGQEYCLLVREGGQDDANAYSLLVAPAP